MKIVTTKILFFTLVGLSAFFGPIQAVALGGSTITTLHSTGQGLSTGIVDPNWTLVQAPSGATLDGDDTFTIPAGGRSVAAPSGTQWIGPNPSTSFAEPPGVYAYQTTFNLTGFIASTALIVGEFAADNKVASISLNGAGVPLGSNGGLDSLTYFTINSGFSSGVNTLDFFVYNSGSKPNPTGLLVDFTIATATATAVPQPTSFMLLAIGFCGGATVLARVRFRTPDRLAAAGS
jgi:hypothetical protein